MRTLVKKRIAQRKRSVSAKTWKRMFLSDEIDVMSVLIHELDGRIKQVLATLGIEDEYLSIRREAEQAIDPTRVNAAVDRANALMSERSEIEEIGRVKEKKLTKDRFRGLKV